MHVDKSSIHRDVEEDKDQSIEFEIQKERKHRMIVEREVQKLAKKNKSLLDDKSKEIIKRINTKNLKKPGQLMSLGRDSKKNHSASNNTSYGYESAISKQNLVIQPKLPKISDQMETGISFLY